MSYHLFPIEEIPPRTEVVIVARSEGRNWIPTSGVKGELLFVNTRQTVSFQINFSNSMSNDGRVCYVNAAVSPNAELKDGQWRISREIIDNQKNYEVLVTIIKSHRFGSMRMTSTRLGDQHPKSNIDLVKDYPARDLNTKVLPPNSYDEPLKEEQPK